MTPPTRKPPPTTPHATREPAARTPRTTRVRLGRLIECLVLFFGVPIFAALAVDPQQRFGVVMRTLRVDRVLDLPVPISGLVFPSLFAFSLPLLLILVFDRTFDTTRLWNARGAISELPRIALWFVFGGAAVLALAFVMEAAGMLPDGGVFRLPREAPIVVLIILVFYPWLSCYPQEVSHRAYFIHRYRPVFGDGAAMILINALAFSIFHLAFWNIWAIAMTFLGGMLFAYTYTRSRSTLAATLEHAVYGWWAFVTGAGWFVYAGSVQ